ncbi:MAG: 3D-(3,5/4)-trihydroxycyclohexane-1,2-dione acylhydrolase (decyclizing) [Flavobacteriaceae bacterium]|tara:strand:+ start:2044 stop:3903 length:1860 start_codon:yes stop_codon:yes gene_type:complete
MSSKKVIKLTAAQALIRFMIAQKVKINDEIKPLFPGVWAIFGHGNVAGIGEALFQHQEALPTYRGQNEQSMAHAAIAYSKTLNRQQIMACTSSAGPGSTNIVTAAALAHINRIPLLLLPGDTFATRIPDPVLQQLEDNTDQTITTNDCFKPVSRFFDRIMRPEQLLTSLPQAIRVLTDPVDTGTVTIAFPQDVQTMSWNYPERFFEEKIHFLRRQHADENQLKSAVQMILKAKKPVIIAGGGIHYSLATKELEDFSNNLLIPIGETQAGKGAIPWENPMNVGSVGVTGGSACNELLKEADLIIAIGTRLGDFITGSRTLFNSEATLLSINVCAYDSIKHRALSLVGDAKLTLNTLMKYCTAIKTSNDWQQRVSVLRKEWLIAVDEASRDKGTLLPSDGEVVGAVNRSSRERDVVVCAAGGLPGDLQKLWKTSFDRGYHVEYGYSCMGYEIAGGLGVKMALPDSQVYVMVGDGSYLMMNSEIFSSVMLGLKLIIVVVDNGGYGCIHRLQENCGNSGFNNLIRDCRSTQNEVMRVDFAAHARSMGAKSEEVEGIASLENALERARNSETTYVINILTDPNKTVEEGGNWWDVAVAEVSNEKGVNKARKNYELQKEKQIKNL